MSGNTGGKQSGLQAIWICPDAEISEQFRRAAAGVPELQIAAPFSSYPGLAELQEACAASPPDILVVDVFSDRESGVSLIAQAADQWPDLSIVALHRSNDPETILQCLRAGSSEFLSSPFTPADLAPAVERMLRRKSIEPRQEAASRGRVLAFAPVKGGVGSTTLACNSAYQLRKMSKKPVLLADFNLGAGIIAFLLRLQHPYGVLDALRHSGQLDPSLWGNLVLQHDGVDILKAPDRPEPAIIEPYPAQEVLEYARSNYDYVVLDLGSVTSSLAVGSLGASDDIFLVCGTDMPSLYLMRRTIPLLEEMGQSRDQIHVLVNRVERRPELSREDMEKIFRAKVHATFPEDSTAVERALRDGAWLPDNCDLAKSIRSFVKDLAGAAASSAPRAFGVKALKELLTGT